MEACSNLFGDALDMGTHFGQVGVDFDGNHVAGAGGGVVEINVAEAVVDQRSALTGEGTNVGTVVGQSFSDRRLFGGGIVAEDGHVPFAPGKEIDFSAHKDGVEIGGLLMRESRLNRARAGW